MREPSTANRQPSTNFLHENRRELTVLFLLGAVAVAAYYFFPFGQAPELSTVEERGVLDLEQITVNDYYLERKRWKLTGELAVVLEESRRMRIEKVRIWVYTPNKPTNSSEPQSSENSYFPIEQGDVVPLVDLYITADQGLIEWRDNRVTLSGNVLLLRNDGSEIHTKTAIYNAKEEILTLPKPVRVLREGHTLRGSGLTYYVSKGQLNLKNPVLVRHDPLGDEQ